MAFLPQSRGHNICAFLNESHPRAHGFREMLHFTNRTQLVHALTAQPVLYKQMLNDFWVSAVETIHDEQQTITAIVGGQELVISEQVIREVLQFGNDQDGVLEINEDEILGFFENFIGYTGGMPRRQILKGKMGPKWKFLAHILQHCLSKRRSGWFELPLGLSSMVMCVLLSAPFNFSRTIFNGMISNIGAGNSKFLMYPRFLQMIINHLLPNVQPYGEVIHNLIHQDHGVFSLMKRGNFEGVDVGFPQMSFDLQDALLEDQGVEIEGNDESDESSISSSNHIDSDVDISSDNNGGDDDNQFYEQAFSPPHHTPSPQGSSNLQAGPDDQGNDENLDLSPNLSPIQSATEILSTSTAPVDINDQNLNDDAMSQLQVPEELVLSETEELNLSATQEINFSHTEELILSPQQQQQQSSSHESLQQHHQQQLQQVNLSSAAKIVPSLLSFLSAQLEAKDSMTNQLTNETAETDEIHREECQNYESVVEEQSVEISRLMNEIAYRDDHIAIQNDYIEMQNLHVAGLTNQVIDLMTVAAHADRCNEFVAKFTNDLNSQANEIDSLKAQLADCQRRLRIMIVDRETHATYVNELREKVAAAKREMKNAQEAQDKKGDHIAQLQDDIKILKAQLAAGSDKSKNDQADVIIELKETIASKEN